MKIWYPGWLREHNESFKLMEAHEFLVITANVRNGSLGNQIYMSKRSLGFQHSMLRHINRNTPVIVSRNSSQPITYGDGHQQYNVNICFCVRGYENMLWKWIELTDLNMDTGLYDSLHNMNIATIIRWCVSKKL